MSDTVALTQGLQSHIRTGVVIAGKYRLEEEIGRGSMGTVYRAVHVTLGQRVAVKLISTEHLQSSEARKRFSVEAKAAAKLRSRHVVTVYDDGETAEGNPYIVLELLEGETLEQRIEREHDVPLADAVRVTAHVGRALARAHAQGIVHRDLKPANVFLVRTDDDELGWIAKVLDFGIAKLDGHGEKGTTQAGTVLGTPLFMSPEQVRGASSVDHRADLYSLGMCLYHMLTGEFAYYSPSYSEILVGICTRPLPRLREKAPWVPEAVEQWFQRACARDPLERFQSADEMTEALQAASGNVTLSKHKSVPEGRIAPETLVGYATPAGATLRDEASTLSLSRTQVLANPRSPIAEAPLVPIAVGGAHRASDVSTTGSEWLPRKRSFSPLLIGAGFGLLTVLGFTVAFKLLSKQSESQAGSASSAPSSSSARAVPSVGAPDTSVAAPTPPEPAVSSVATAELPPSGATRRAPATLGGGRKPTTPPRGKPAGPPSGPARPSASDLGF
jgi:eukaryotic-like serine/threonine-protein kinase